MHKQVSAEHYDYARYVDQKRWSSLWHQLDESMRLRPSGILEIGPGPGLFKSVAAQIGLQVQTLDIDAELKPDHVASVFDMPFTDGRFDLVCAFQMLEHLPFEQSLQAFAEMARVARRHVLISLPDARPVYPVSIALPWRKRVQMLVPSPRWWALEHVFDGEHHWEINKAGYPLQDIVSEMQTRGAVRLQKTYRVHANPYHRFLCFGKPSGKAARLA